jgi:hypothetical protein
MQSIVRTFALTVALVGGACGKGDDSCGELTAKIAKSTGAAKAKVAALVDKELTGPSGEALKGDQREAACKMIVSDKDALEGYTASIKTQLGK